MSWPDSDSAVLTVALELTSLLDEVDVDRDEPLEEGSLLFGAGDVDVDEDFIDACTISFGALRST